MLCTRPESTEGTINEKAIELFWAPLIGAVMAVALAGAVELWNGRGRRRIYGTWLCAIQPVYYRTTRWHIQEVRAAWSWRRLGIEFRTVNYPGKLQWTWFPKLKEQAYLVGDWRSERPGSTSHGTMIVHISTNGLYMFGHDHGVISKDGETNFGVLLFGRHRANLESAWSAMSKGTRRMLNLAEAVDFLPDGQLKDVIWKDESPISEADAAEPLG
ncbi:MAG: hypothetical protein WAK33_02990 [Silvibacterium sp.]